ncbi:MAG TPA: thioesterase family protein [Burkholderiales bacterium]
MNLYFRLLLTFIKAWRAPRIQPEESVELAFRVLPTDLDLNGHMNNGRYLTMVDLALATVFVRSGFFRLARERRWGLVGGGSVVYFRRALTLFQKYRLRFTVAGWDEFWTYSRFEFIRGGELCANGFVKGAASDARGLVPNAQIYPVLGYDVPSPEFPDDLKAWIAADRLLGERTKAANGRIGALTPN